MSLKYLNDIKLYTTEGQEEVFFSTSSHITPTKQFYLESGQNTFIYDDDTQPEHWLKLIDRISIDFNSKHEVKDIKILKRSKDYNKKYNELIDDFLDAINSYTSQDEQNSLKKISEKSAKTFLYLVPTINRYAPHVSIDADTGYFSVTFQDNDHSILSALITDKNEVSFSFVGQGNRIFKISGVAKLKHSRDLEKFNKILLML